jgi:hypothetical protein
MRPATKQLLRLTILLQACCALATLVLDAVFHARLPAEILEYALRAEEAPLSLVQQIGYGLGLLVLLGFIGSLIGLWKMQPSARSLYTVCLIVSLLLFFVLEPAYCFSAPGFAVSQCALLVSGFTLALLYFSDLSVQFER